VTLLAGTDLGVITLVPGFALHDELELLVEAGLTRARRSPRRRSTRPG